VEAAAFTTSAKWGCIMISVMHCKFSFWLELRPFTQACCLNLNQLNMPVVTAHAILISEHTSPIMSGQLVINQRFGKSYMARSPIKKLPLPNTTVISFWHSVSEH
jgi:hypothetical protein